MSELQVTGRYDALYARQSVEKADSISVESQLEFCNFEARGQPCVHYVDRGYSGKNTNRPAFSALLNDVRQGKIARVIVYKLDRISRSILDFTNMMAVFERHQVEFISSTERFDTSAPIGRAMLNICIVFAQLERETIQKRVQDAYDSRSRRGFYMGGRIPYGFSKTNTVIDGIQTAMYCPCAAEAEQVILLYKLYADHTNSLGDIVRNFGANGIAHLRGGTWSTARISELLRNPIYVRADAEVYAFFQSQGATVINHASDFSGYHACYLYTPSGQAKTQLVGSEVVLAPHEGLVDAQEWLACRRRCLSNRQSTRTCKPKNSWLAGKIKCGRCHHALTIAKANTRWGRYLVCSQALSTKKIACSGTGSTVYADALERYIKQAILVRLQALAPLSACAGASPCQNEIKLQITAVEQHIGALLTKVPDADPVLMQYISRELSGLDVRRQQLLGALALEQDTEHNHSIINPAEGWDALSFTDWQAVVDILIDIITICDGKLHITWKI